MKTDILHRDDVTLLVNTFYEHALQDPLLKPVFDQFIDFEKWPMHVTKIIDFWSMVIFKNNDYSGNVFSKHVPMKLTETQIEAWVKIFTTTVHSLFEGPNADEAYSKATMMGKMFVSKIKSSKFHDLI